ncbi:class I SAM-dependent methyltransferase [Nocardioides jishulii]|uniref:Class I SAM-dependent methyltransferase n=1 Tax=Nocardioides jishulii TaxID=2575440 RepID=A0A4U2YL15_9ACTN|nr:class I SAM-dependent methyltransferase [Nocardioides jishulii]TKI61897.1 class I SAM-dependent methyltransferase [Nocardioides jishulii]
MSSSRPPAGGLARDDWRRSVKLFRSFLTEQTDPEGFYGLIADDTLDLLRRHVDIEGRTIADFGGAAGFYSDAFRRAGATSLVVDLDHTEIVAHGVKHPLSVVARAEQSPLRDESVDIGFSSNMLEHVPDLASVADQIARVVKPGGYVVLSYTAWYGPWGGHETSPWHLLGGERAARRYERKTGRPPKNVFGESMYAATVAEGMAWARSRDDLVLLEERPRYLPPASRHLLKVPGLREVLTWNLWQVLRKK